jgi:sialic acid synthase SpsE
MNKTFIISEIGINHNGDLDIAKKMIDLSKELLELMR